MDELGQFDFFKAFPATTLDNMAAYAETYLASPGNRTVKIGVESDDDVIMWLNGTQLEHQDVARGVGTATDTLTLHLHRGVNRLVYAGFQFLMRCSNNDRMAFPGTSRT